MLRNQKDITLYFHVDQLLCQVNTALIKQKQLKINSYISNKSLLA